ncbi:MAG: winged helix-turn-helix transcriptional regulator [Alphaproteobacteria bacterium]|nr:winged helix-turn-helix transcriptional regulator [Alphaproteobacteria bacterium]
MQRIKLDAIDRRILHELQANGRITNVELSKRAKISAPPCLRRVRALEQAGFIRGYHADLDPKTLGYEVMAFAFVGLASQAEPDLKAFEAQVTQWPIVRECYMMSGEVDFILKCAARDLSEWQSFVTEKLTAAKNVASVKTTLTIRSSKRDPGVPIEI